MTNAPLQKITIVGGGTAGWMAGASLAKLLRSETCQVTLIESEDIGTVGVGEATIPQILLFNKLLEIDEDDFIKKTQGSFKLGIEFVNWGSLDSSYFHAFGSVGKDMRGVQFYHYWLKMRAQGKAADIDDYTLSSQACLQKKFMRPIDAGNSPLSKVAYAYHFDAGLYAAYLREYAEQRGLIRVEGKVVKTHLRDDGFIRSVELENGDLHEADFFIDCSGFRGLLIEEALKTGYVDWTHWLPCDRAVAVACERTADPIPYTRSTARSAGWQWRIPLQHRTGNGHVYSSKFMSDDEARKILLDNLDGAPISEPKQLRFVTGMRKKFWNKNCLALGLASGFMEPLESTSIHLMQAGLAKFMSFFPNKNCDAADVDEYNRQMTFDFERIRDFLIAHYHVTDRDDTEFWRYCKTMDIPDSLAQKIEQFKANGRVYRQNNEMFSDLSWFELMYGQGIVPRGYHSLVDNIPEDELQERLEGIRSVISQSVDYMPTHQEFIDKNCRAKTM
ncbi:tryptophan halogenase family protein [Gilvimarinus polysaccharolyticus]|uniref:tryptophan halogenase family protein n=1 Tax=Gilvimarinus polysaccharolyticus TaxID=863921 RepID=UPI000673AB49|nr:tryptophan halogenase family protein [Gilvimarinus polysaccharolyticus]